jgi:hypothetical protein
LEWLNFTAIINEVEKLDELYGLVTQGLLNQIIYIPTIHWPYSISSLGTDLYPWNWHRFKFRVTSLHEVFINRWLRNHRINFTDLCVDFLGCIRKSGNILLLTLLLAIAFLSLLLRRLFSILFLIPSFSMQHSSINIKLWAMHTN